MYHLSPINFEFASVDIKKIYNLYNINLNPRDFSVTDNEITKC